MKLVWAPIALNQAEEIADFIAADIRKSPEMEVDCNHLLRHTTL